MTFVVGDLDDWRTGNIREEPALARFTLEIGSVA
jgi:hypothetical protein